MRGVTAEEQQRAYDEWGSNCGPGAIAAIADMPLDQVRHHMGDFEDKRYTNPTLMWAALRSVLARFTVRSGKLGQDAWPEYGLARIQWEGPWTEPGVPARIAYRHTHWVGAHRRLTNRDDVGIFDVNAVGNGTGWVSLAAWRDTLVPWILEACEPKANGGWYITHAVEVRRDA